MAVEAVCLDVGETLINEERVWRMWAQWLGTPEHIFFAAFGAAISQGKPLDVFNRFKPNFDLDAELEARREAGKLWVPEAGDLYEDAQPAVRLLGEVGLRVCIAGNQDASMGAFLRENFPTADTIGTSEEWGVSKPNAGFFARVSEELDIEPRKIVYIGDRADYDVYAAQEQGGMPTIQVIRGLWGRTLDQAIPTLLPHAAVNSLLEVPDVISRLG